MKTALTAAMLALSLGSIALAADKPLTPQQEKMKSCNAEATSKGINGPERQKFMGSCLHASTGKTLSPQQEKMKSCNAEATSKGLKGSARKSFMSGCLKAS